MSDGDRQMRPLTRQQALQKLASAQFGRVVFTQHVMPAIRPQSTACTATRWATLAASQRPAGPPRPSAGAANSA